MVDPGFGLTLVSMSEVTGNNKAIHATATREHRGIIAILICNNDMLGIVQKNASINGDVSGYGTDDGRGHDMTQLRGKSYN